MPFMIRSRPRDKSINSQETDVQKHYRSSTGAARYHLIRLRPFDVRYFLFVLGEDDEVISE